MGPSISCPQVTVIPSRNPQEDATSFRQLFVDYQQEDATKRSVTLSLHDNSNNNSDDGTTSRSIVIFCQDKNNNSASAAPSLPAVLVVPSLSIMADGAQHQAGIEVVMSSEFESSSSPRAVVLRFENGGSLLVAESQEGLSRRLAQWLLEPDSILHHPHSGADAQNGSRNTTTATTTTTTTTAGSKQHGKVTSIPSTNNNNNNSDLPKFPTLRVTVNDEAFPLNNREPVPIETDFFAGKALVLVRPPNPQHDDPYWNERVFSKKRRRFIVQVQGKFKREPRGMLYFGGEVSEPMKLGLVTKGVCSLILKFLDAITKIHSSFGSDDEKAHIVGSAWAGWHEIIVTKPGETPPDLTGTDLMESKESVEKRRKCKGTVGPFNTTDTFTLCFHSMYLDLPTWSAVQLPVAPSLALRTFWGKSTLKICMYDTPPDCKRHKWRDNNYFLSMELEFLGLDAGRKKADNDSSAGREEEENSLPFSLRTRSISFSNFATETSLSDGYVSPDRISEEDDEDEEFFFDAEEPDENVSIQYQTTAQQVVPLNACLEADNLLDAIDLVCPMWIDMCNKGKYAKAYAVNINQRTLFRQSSCVSENFEVEEAKETVNQRWSPRLSSCERTRRIVGQVVSSAISNSAMAGRVRKFVKASTSFDSTFLRGTPPTLPAKRSRCVHMSSFVARAFSDRHWIEEWMKVTDTQLSFYHPERLHKANLRVSLRSILSVRALSPSDAPEMPSYSFLEIRTLGQTVYLMFHKPQLRDSWVAYLSTVLWSGNSTGLDESRNSVASEALLHVDNPSKEFLHKSSMWNCKQRRLLNCHKMSFRSSLTLNPRKQVEIALRKALRLKEDSDDQDLCDFLDSTAGLKQVDVSVLEEKERLSFFLNLYHLMIVHAYLVLSPPDSTFKWLSYFNTIAYQCSDDVFSVTELEHNILRAAMNYPSQVVSKFVLPKSQFSFALKNADYRINFALNCGSLSNPSCVPIYKPEILHAQLDEACRQYLKVTEVATHKRNVTVTLPRICAWFADDFEDGSATDVLKLVLNYLKPDQQEILAKCWDGSRFSDVHIKHFNYNFECRTLVLSEDDEEEGDWCS